MKKRIIRILTVMLLVCFGMTLFAACNGNGGGKEETKTYTVTYEANEGTGKGPSAESYAEGATFTVKQCMFTREGYDFTKWNDGSKDVEAGSTYTMPAKNVVFKAQWQEKGETPPAQKFTVTYSLGEYTDGTAPAAVEVESGKEATLPEAPAWPGHNFTGWKVGDDAALKQVGDKITVTADVTVTAQWEVQKEQVTVTFDLGDHSDGKAIDPVKTNKGEDYTLPAGPSAEDAPNFDKGEWAGYLFAGWKIGETEEVKQAGEKITPNEAVTLTAQWKEVSFQVTGATLEATDEVMYVVVSGLYDGFTAEEFIAAQQDSNKNEVYFSVSLGVYPWTGQNVDCTTEAEDGEFHAKLDVTALEKGVPYSVLADASGYGDIKTLTVEESKDLGDKKYSLKGSSGGLVLTIGEAGKTYSFTAMKVEAEGNKVYLTVSGAYSGYTDAEIKGLFEDDDKKAQCVSITTTAAVGDLNKWAYLECAMTVNAANGQFAVKLDVTDVPVVIYYICENQSGSGDIAWNQEAFSSTVTANGKKYTIEKNAYGNTQLKVEAVAEPEPPAEITFSEPTSATLEVIKSNGREEGKLFREEVDAAFLVLKGTYTGNATEADANEYFSMAKYSFKFTTKEWKDRLRRISIDTSAKTWTVKFDVTSLPVGDNKCVVKDVDLKLTVGADATKSVKSLGSTFTLTNTAEGVLAVNVRHDYTVSNVDLVLNDEGKPCLVMTGTYDEEVWTGADIKKFFEDDDIRTLSLNLVAYIWPMNDTYNVDVTAENGQYTVKLDISGVAETAGTGVLSEASGYGDITTVTVNKTVEYNGKLYTLEGTAGSKLMLKVAAKA